MAPTGFRFDLTSSCILEVRQGDITACVADAIVNAANERMLGGLGVDGAIHLRAGPQLVEACRRLPEVRPDVRCPRGEARITSGFDLPCEYVIHTVGPIYDSDPEPETTLASAYRSSLDLANEHALRHIAFPAISCGVYGYPFAEAAQIAIKACASSAADLGQIDMVLFGEEIFQVWLAAANDLLRGN